MFTFRICFLLEEFHEFQHPPSNTSPILRVNYDNVIKVVLVIVPVVHVKLMIGATTRIRQIGTILGSPWIDLISCLQSFKLVISDFICIVAQIHSSWMCTSHFTQVGSNLFSITCNISTTSSNATACTVKVDWFCPWGTVYSRPSSRSSSTDYGPSLVACVDHQRLNPKPNKS